MAKGLLRRNPFQDRTAAGAKRATLSSTEQRVAAPNTQNAPLLKRSAAFRWPAKSTRTLPEKCEKAPTLRNPLQPLLHCKACNLHYMANGGVAFVGDLIKAGESSRQLHSVQDHRRGFITEGVVWLSTAGASSWARSTPVGHWEAVVVASVLATSEGTRCHS